MLNEYKKALILQYFNTMGASYSYNEISMIFGLQAEQVDFIIEELLETDFLAIEGYLTLKEKSHALLEKYSLRDIKFDAIEESNIFTKKPIKFSEVYIPQKFDSKFK